MLKSIPRRALEAALAEATTPESRADIAAKLSRVNQAYYLGVDEYLGHGYSYDQEYLDKLAQLTPDMIRRVTSMYFSADKYILATAGKLQP